MFAPGQRIAKLCRMQGASPVAGSPLAWWLAARPWSFTISLAPVLAGSALSILHGHGMHVGIAAAALLASILIHAGTNLQNDQGESVGEINDLVLDANTGRVRYLAVTYGGFLGVGDKLFAVPFEAVKVRQDRDDADEYVLVLNVTRST